MLGNQRLIEERQHCSPTLQAALAIHEQQGRTFTLLAGEQGVLAFVAVADTIKETSPQAIAGLKALDVPPVMFSSDNAATVRAVAIHAGMDDARGNLLHEDKLANDLRRLRNKRKGAAMRLILHGVSRHPNLQAKSACGTRTACTRSYHKHSKSRRLFK